MTIILFSLLATIIFLTPCLTAHSTSTQHPSRIMPPRTVRSTQIPGRRRQDEGTTGTSNPQKEKAPDITNGPNATTDDSPMDVDENWPTLAQAVVSPPPAPNLTSLLSGHTGEEEGSQPTIKDNATVESNLPLDDVQAEDMSKAPSKKKPKKTKTTKDDSSTKRDRSGSSLKKSSYTNPIKAVGTTPSAKDYKFERVYYEAGLELKGEDKYSAYVKNIGNLLENIQLVDPLAIMHAVDESGGAKPLGSKSEMSTNMTLFLAYAPVGRNTKAFQTKKNTNMKKGKKGKDEPSNLEPSVYPTMVFSSDVDPETIVSRVSHEFGRAGGFYFRKKQIQCEETTTPFIIYFLYTFNDIATIREELTSLLNEALKEMTEDLILPDEFELSSLPVINIRRGVPKLPGQPGSNFRDYSREMQEARRAHLIECDIKAIPFLRLLINYIKEHKLTIPIWGGHTHITETVDWDSPKGDVSRFVRMSQDHTNYNMSLISVQVNGITDLEASAEVKCPESGDVLGHLSLRQTLLKYLKLPDGNPMCAELHQRGFQTPVDMIIPNTPLAERTFEMFNKQPAGYLYNVLPEFGASTSFIQSLLRRSMEAGLTTEAPLCTYNPDTHILTTPRDNEQEGVLSDVRSLPFFKDVIAEKLAVDTSKKSKKAYTAPEMCFQLGSARSVQTVHGANEGKHNNIPEPGIDLRPNTMASAAKSSNADQPVVEIASSEDDASSNDESEGSDDTSSSSDDSSASTPSVGVEQLAPAGGG